MPVAYSNRGTMSGARFNLRKSVIAIFVVYLASVVSAQLPQQEIDAINAFRATVYPEPSQWWNITNPCDLSGDYCNQTNGGLHVLGLAVSSGIGQVIQVSIGSWIGSLPYLGTLRFSTVNFSSPISGGLSSTSLGNLVVTNSVNLKLPPTLPSTLGYIFISDSDITEMPNLAGSSVIQLTIQNCPSLVGTIPNHYATATGLKDLTLNNLPGLSGSIPNFGNSLYRLDISFTKVSGQIPSISPILGITLSGNALTGTIPSSLFTSTVEAISITSNQLTGAIPSEISQAVALTSLGLGQNQLTGPIPSGLYSLPGLTSLDLNGNNFTGPVSDFSQANALMYLDLSYNQFSGSVPTFLAPKLISAKLNNNKLSGTISRSALAVKSLQLLDLSFNGFTGTIPEIGPYLAQLALHGNQLTGSVPFTNNLRLSTLILAFNQLTGSIPRIGGSLRMFVASNNLLSGFLPTNVSKDLIYLDLSNNHMFGEIPPVYSQLHQLVNLDLSNNGFSGCFNATTSRTLTGCSMGGNYLCCVPQIAACSSADLDCPNCPSPSPDSRALCQYDRSRRSVWVVLTDLVVTQGTTLYNTVVFGDLNATAGLTVNGGVIDVKGCAQVQGTLTVVLTDEEISELMNKGNLTRDVIKFNSTCSNDNTEFDSVTYKGDVPCTNTTIVQKNTANTIAVIVTSQKVTCPGDLPGWGIGLIVVGCVVAAGAAIGIGLGVKSKKDERRHNVIREQIQQSNSARRKRAQNEVDSAD